MLLPPPSQFVPLFISVSNDISQYLPHLGTGGGEQTCPLPDPKGTRLVLALRAQRQLLWSSGVSGTQNQTALAFQSNVLAFATARGPGALGEGGSSRNQGLHLRPSPWVLGPQGPRLTRLEAKEVLPLSGFCEQDHPLRTPGPRHPISPRASETQLKDSQTQQWGGYRHANNRHGVTVCL